MTFRAETSEGEWLTVAEASQALGVSIRTVRRLLSEAEYGGRTQAVQRQTSKGTRLTTVLPPELVAQMRSRVHLGNPPKAEAASGSNAEAGNGVDSEAHSGANGGALPNVPANDTEATPGILPAVAYQRVIAEQSARIEDLKTRLDQADRREGELLGALKQAQENLQREQSLRLLMAPMAETLPETPVDTWAAPEAAPVTPQASQEEAQTPVPGKTPAVDKTPVDRRIYGLGAKSTGPPETPRGDDGKEPVGALQKLLRWLRQDG